MVGSGGPAPFIDGDGVELMNDPQVPDHSEQHDRLDLGQRSRSRQRTASGLTSSDLVGFRASEDTWLRPFELVLSTLVRPFASDQRAAVVSSS
jgi:hypothetical protein